MFEHKFDVFVIVFFLKTYSCIDNDIRSLRLAYLWNKVPYISTNSA